MPFVVEEDSVINSVGLLPEVPFSPELEFFRDILPAGFRRENILGETFIPPRFRARKIVADEIPDQVEPGFNPFDDLEERYIPFAEAFVSARNPTEKRAIQNRIDRELVDRQTLAAAGFRGFVASMAGGLIDPIILIPVGGVAARVLTKGRGLLKGGAVTGFSGFLGSSVSESILQAEQETRTFGESALNITAASVLSGALGVGASALSAKQLSRLTAETETILGGEAPLRVAGGMGDEGVRVTPEDIASDVADGTEIVEGKLKSAFGVDKALSRFLSSPLTRVLVRSRSNTARKTLLDLADTPVLLEKNALGESSGPSVESMVRLHTAGLGEAVESMGSLFVRMKTGKPGGRAKRTVVQLRDRLGRRDLDDITDMTHDEFKIEISRTMRRGDKHPIPEVQEAAEIWRTKVFDPLKDRAIEAKLLPEDVSVDTALSYLTRVYNRPKIEALRGTTGGLEVQSRAWLAERHPELSPEQVTDIAEQITDRILGLEGGRVLIEPVQLSGASPLRSRTFSIEDQRIESFLEDDIELIGRTYLRSMASDVELQTRFGSTDLAKEIDGIKADYLKLINKADTNAERKALAGRRDSDIKDIAAMRDLLRGTYARSGNPDSAFVRINKGIRRFNLVRVGGGFMVSSLPDVGSIVMAHGVRRVLGDAVIPMIRNFKGFRMAANEVKLTGTAWDMVLDTRALSFADLGDEFGRLSRFERGFESLSRTFVLANGLSPWNSAMKQFTGVVTQARILDAVTAFKTGKAKPGELEKLAQSGIPKEDWLPIAELFERHGATDRGVRLANTVEWAGEEAVRLRNVFRAAVAKDVDTIIVTPGIADKPLWMSTQTGAMIGQFKSFAMSSVQRVMLLRLQQRDAAALNGLFLATGLGMMVYAQKTLQAGRPLSDDPGVWIREGVDRSGVTGFIFDANNILEKFTRNTIGINALTGGPTASRYASRNVTGALVGPTLGLVETAAKVTGAIATRDVNQSDVRAIRRLVPYQNLFYMDKLFDAAQKGINREFRIPRTSK